MATTHKAIRIMPETLTKVNDWFANNSEVVNAIGAYWFGLILVVSDRDGQIGWFPYSEAQFKLYFEDVNLDPNDFVPVFKKEEAKA
jgi:hypothetical protein